MMNYDDPETVKRIDKVPATVILFSHKKELESGVIVKDGAVVIRENGKETYVMPLSEFQLLGDHNIENLWLRLQYLIIWEQILPRSVRSAAHLRVWHTGSNMCAH